MNVQVKSGFDLSILSIGTLVTYSAPNIPIYLISRFFLSPVWRQGDAPFSSSFLIPIHIYSVRGGPERRRRRNMHRFYEEKAGFQGKPVLGQLDAMGTAAAHAV